jgi:hypothetical protein
MAAPTNIKHLLGNWVPTTRPPQRETNCLQTWCRLANGLLLSCHMHHYCGFSRIVGTPLRDDVPLKIWSSNLWSAAKLGRNIPQFGAQFGAPLPFPVLNILSGLVSSYVGRYLPFRVPIKVFFSSSHIYNTFFFHRWCRVLVCINFPFFLLS